MKTELSAQTSGFLLFILTGAALALLFLLDLRLSDKKKKIVVSFYDLLFCLISFVLLICAVLICGGKLELHMLFGAFLGSLLVFIIFVDLFYKKRRF